MVAHHDGYLTKAQLAAEGLRAAIRQGDLQPGARLDMEALGELLGMSTTPIREALRSLEAEGLLRTEAHRGVHVTEFSADEAAALYDLRALLESYAIGIAASSLTNDDLGRLEELIDDEVRAIESCDQLAASECNQLWHELIYSRATSTPYLLEFIHRLWNMFPWSTTWDVDGRYTRSIDDHRAILRALRQRDAATAQALLRAHILFGKELVVDILNAPRDSPD